MAYVDDKFRSEVLRYLDARLKLENEKIKQLTRIANTIDDIYKRQVDDKLKALIPSTYVSPEVMDSTKGGEYGRLTVASDGEKTWKEYIDSQN